MLRTLNRSNQKAKILLLIIAAAFLTVAAVFIETEASEDQYTGRVSGDLIRLNEAPLPEGMQVVLVSAYGGYYPDEMPRSEHQGEFQPEAKVNAPLARGLDHPQIEAPFGAAGSQMGRPESWGSEASSPRTIEPEEALYLEPPVATATVNAENGAFEFTDVPFGDFLLYVLPPEGSNLIGSNTPYITLSQPSVSVGTILLQEAQLTGSLYEQDGTTPANGSIVLTSKEASPFPIYLQTESIQGRFFMKDIPVGEYEIIAYPAYDPYADYAQQENFPSDPIDVSILSPNETVSVSVSFTGPDLYGTVVDPEGNPIADAEVYISRADGGYIEYNPYIYTGADGRWATGGLKPGTYEINVFAYYEDDLVWREPVTVEVPNEDLPLTLTMETWPEGLKTVTGKIIGNDGVPVDNAVISAYHESRPLFREITSSSDGTFSLDLLGGSWVIRVYPADSSDFQPEWIMPYETVTSVTFEDDDKVETIDLEIEVLRFDSEMTGVVKLDSDEPLREGFGIYLNNFELGVSTYQEGRSDGTFNIKAPAGTYVVDIYPYSYELDPPKSFSITLSQGETLDIGEIIILSSSATIQGAVTANGQPLNEVIEINAYKIESDGYGYRYTNTERDGSYQLKVTPGKWEISPIIYSLDKFAYTGEPIIVEIGPFETINNIDFIFTELNSTISGSLVYPDGEVATGLNGYAEAYPAPNIDNGHGSFTGNGAPINRGLFEIPILAGTYDINVFLDWLQDFNLFPERNVEVTVGENSEAEVEILLKRPTHTITGQVINYRSGEPISGAAGYVYAFSEYYTTETNVDSASGEYALAVVPGQWKINLEQPHHYYPPEEPATFYQMPIPAVSITEESSPTVTVDIPILLNDATVSGQLIDPDGEVLMYGSIYFEGIDELDGFSRYVYTDHDGTFAASLPHGSFLVHAHAYPQGSSENFYMPAPLALTLAADEAAEGFDIAFVRPNVTLEGTLFAAGMTESTEAYIDLSTTFGNYTFVRVNMISNGTDASGTFSTSIVDGEWNIHASAWDGQTVWLGTSNVSVAGDTEIELELFLVEEADHSTTVVEYSAVVEQEAAEISLEDGAKLNIPAGAIPGDFDKGINFETSTFTFATGALRMVDHGYLFSGVGEYSGTLLDVVLDPAVTISVPYDPAALGDVSPNEIEVMAHTLPSNRNGGQPYMLDAVVDTESQTVTFQTDRFIEFALVAPKADLVAFPNLFPNSYYAPFTGAR